MKQTRIDEQFTIGTQPTPDDLAELARSGFKTVINLRLPHEEEDQLLPTDEDAKVRELGMEYLHIPVTVREVRDGQAEDFHAAAKNLPAPIFVHCAGAKRAAALVFVEKARREGWSGEEALRQAEKAGYPIDIPGLRTFMQDYVDRLQAAGK